MSKRIMKCGYILAGEFRGSQWAIFADGKERYVLLINDEFFASADNIRSLLDEVSFLDGGRPLREEVNV